MEIYTVSNLYIKKKPIKSCVQCLYDVQMTKIKLNNSSFAFLRIVTKKTSKTKIRTFQKKKRKWKKQRNISS